MNDINLSGPKTVTTNMCMRIFSYFGTSVVDKWVRLVYRIPFGKSEISSDGSISSLKPGELSKC